MSNAGIFLKWYEKQGMKKGQEESEKKQPKFWR